MTLVSASGTPDLGDTSAAAPAARDSRSRAGGAGRTTVDPIIMLAQAPLIGIDGKPLELGAASAAAFMLSDARMTKHFQQVQERNLADMDRLNARLRKEYDAAKLANKGKMKELQQITAELSTIERIVQSDRAEGAGGLGRAKDATVADLESRIEMVQEDAQAALHNADMYEHMTTRLRQETKDLDMSVDALTEELRGLTSSHETAALSLHQAAAQKQRAVALVHTLSRHLEAGRATRRTKMERVEQTLAEQETRLKAYDEREKRRLTLSMMPRGDLDEDGEDRLKQLFLVRKIYNNMLTRRLRDDTRRTDKLSNAYQRIRTATGLEDVHTIIEKYKTRDMTFAALQAQMKAARDRVDTLAQERRSLVWALDEAQTMGASALESRALYNNVEDYDRRMTDATRRGRESRDRLHRISVLLEECRACMSKMMERLGLDAKSVMGVVAGTSGAPDSTEAAFAPGADASFVADGDDSKPGHEASDRPAGVRGRRLSRGASLPGATLEAVLGGRRGSGTSAALAAATSAAGDASPGAASHVEVNGSSSSAKHVKVVTPEALEHALAALENRVSALLAHLASVFEREEATQASSAKAKAKARRGGGASTVGGAPRAAISLEGVATSAAVTESDAAAHRMSVAALTDKASSRVFQRLMTMPPDISERNVRVNARGGSPDHSAGPLLLMASGGGSSTALRAEAHGAPAVEELSAAMHKSAADLSKLLHGAGAGAVVDRVSLKRLSAMVASNLGRPAGKGGKGAIAPGRRLVSAGLPPSALNGDGLDGMMNTSPRARGEGGASSPAMAGMATERMQVSPRAAF